MLVEYQFILIGMSFAFFVGSLLYWVSITIVQRNIDAEKISIYECGFEPFAQSRSTFEVKFYLVAISFVILDLEIIYLFPWILVIYSTGYIGVVSMFLFVFILGLIHIYELILGALDW